MTLKLPYNLTASLGSKLFPPDTAYTLDEAVEIVDELMYKEKMKFHIN